MSRTSKNLRLVQIFHNPVTAWVILVCGIAVTAAAWKISSRYVSERAEERFVHRTQEIELAIADRMNVYEQALWGGVGLFRASDRVTRKEWRDYVEVLNIGAHWPGIQGMGFSVPVTPEERAAHIEAIRAEGFPEYTIRPEGERPLYSSIVFLEPFDWRNQRAFGFDMWSNAMRREAMARARDSGVAATSGIITLVQETDQDVQRGFLTYLPLYEPDGDLTNTEGRRRAFRGWVYAAFRAGDLMGGILGSGGGDVDFEIFDGTELNDDNRLYRSGLAPTDSIRAPTQFARLREIDVQGRTWTLHFYPKAGYLAGADDSTPTLIAVAGLAIDFLLFYLISALAYLHRRATRIAEDMTSELRSAKADLEVKVTELERSNDELEKFAYVASHDLQEPLRMVASYADLFGKKYRGHFDERGEEWLGFLIDGAHRMQALVRDLLTYSRVGQREYNLGAVDLNETFDSAVADLMVAIEESDAEITKDPLPVVLGDAGQIRLVLQNLISNAIKFRDPHHASKVHVGASQSGDVCTLFVRDNGIGIDPEFADRIFVIFQRLHGKDEYSGTGIGLAICKKVIERHCGRIWLESTPGGGSAFFFTLTAAGED